MTPQSAKAKGRILAKQVQELLLKKYSQLENDDVRTTPSGVNGPDLQLSPRARELHPYSYECKNYAAFSGYKHYDQAAAGCTEGTTPIVVIRANRRRALVMLDYETFMELLK